MKMSKQLSAFARLAAPLPENKHRGRMNDLQWAMSQPLGPARFAVGDVVEFKVGGFGIISGVSAAHDGWPCSYAATRIAGVPFHARGVGAWHYEGDIKRIVARSAIAAAIKKLTKEGVL